MFEATLKTLVGKVPGAQSAAVLNLDGLVIEAVDAEGAFVEPDDALPEYGLIVRQLADIGGVAAIGGVEQVTVDGEKRTTLIRKLDDNYVAALVVDSGAVLGKAHFYLRVAAPDLAREL